MGKPFLHGHRRFKNGKDHCYWSLTQKVRTHRGWVQRPIPYLGEINDSQKASWTKVVEVFDQDRQRPAELALYPADKEIPSHAASCGVPVALAQFTRHRPRQWGACWVGCKLWDQLQRDEFWQARLPCSGEGTNWRHILPTLVLYRLIDPGSEWRLHRQWFANSALADLLEEDFALAEKDNLYRCLDQLLAQWTARFQHWRQRWEGLFAVKFEVLLYDLTSTYFESDPPETAGVKRQLGYSRDQRSDCVQVIIAFIVTPEGYPLAYEVLAGNPADKTTLKGALAKIQALYGQAERIWVMDRGIPTKEDLQAMRESPPPVYYLVGTPRGRSSQYEKRWLDLPWQGLRAGVKVKLLPQDQELYVLAESQDRVHKERSMRRRQLKGLWQRLQELQVMELSRDQLLLKLGAAKSQFRQAGRLVEVTWPAAGQAVTAESFTFRLNKKKLRQARRREGRYLLQSNLVDQGPAPLWNLYVQLTQGEAAFKDIKGDLRIRPSFHQLERRIEAHIFVTFLAYCLHISLRAHLRQLAPGLPPRAVLDKLAAIQRLDVHFPTTDGRELIFRRYTQPEKGQKMLRIQWQWELPPPSSPRITSQDQLLER